MNAFLYRLNAKECFCDERNLVKIHGEPKKVAPAGVGFVFGVVFSEGVESSEKEDGRSDNGKVDHELFKWEFVVLPLENVLVEGVDRGTGRY